MWVQKKYIFVFWTHRLRWRQSGNFSSPTGSISVIFLFWSTSQKKRERENTKNRESIFCFPKFCVTQLSPPAGKHLFCLKFSVVGNNKHKVQCTLSILSLTSFFLEIGILNLCSITQMMYRPKGTMVIFLANYGLSYRAILRNLIIATVCTVRYMWVMMNCERKYKKSEEKISTSFWKGEILLITITSNVKFQNTQKVDTHLGKCRCSTGKTSSFSPQLAS